MISKAEYIWLDGTKPTQELRSKTRILELDDSSPAGIENFPTWSFDGSSTNQSTGDNSDLLLQPARIIKDPLREENDYLVLCEVLNGDGSPHESNKRSILRNVIDALPEHSDPWVGFEQEYTLFDGINPLGWPENGFPGPQGPFYCGVGANKTYGREIVEAHTEACIEAGIMIFGTNAEVMPGQWEFQIGYRGVKGEDVNTLTLSDHLWLARWLLKRIAEDFHVSVSFENKPVKGDWNGAGCHTNFSTRAMRAEETGSQAINDAIEALKVKHSEHITCYGAQLEERLTGLHETCCIKKFRAGVADRGASIRVPQQVQLDGCGYFEDRRPGANCDPYVVSARLITTVEGLDEKILSKKKPTKVCSN